MRLPRFSKSGCLRHDTRKTTNRPAVVVCFLRCALDLGRQRRTPTTAVTMTLTMTVIRVQLRRAVPGTSRRYGRYTVRGECLPYKNVRYVSSESTTTSSWDGFATKGSDATKPIAVFPWRHDVSPLRRLDPDLAQENGGVFGPMAPVMSWQTKAILNNVAAYQMNVSFPQLFFGTWKEDLAESTQWAFSQSVAALLSGSYRGESA